MPFGRPGTGGGGLHFRNPPDIYTGANLVACRAARDAYFTGAGATALPQFVSDRSLAIILDPADDPDNTFETYIGSTTYDGDDWLARTDAIQGNPGRTGDDGDPGGKGDRGDPGERGSRWTVTDADAPASPAGAQSGDQQLLNTGEVHSYDGSDWQDSGVNIRGPRGDDGDVMGGTDLSVDNRDADSLDVVSNTGDDATLPAATETLAGLESAADKAQLGDLPPTWAAGVHAVDAQVAWDSKVYRCLVAREATDTDNPATDTTGWAELGTGSADGAQFIHDDTISGAGSSESPYGVANPFTDDDEAKLDGIQEGAEVNDPTNLGVGSRTADTLDVTSTTGDDATVPSATDALAGLLPGADKGSLDASPALWSAGVHAVGDQVAWGRRIYRCAVARTATDTDNPATDTTGWRDIGALATATSAGLTELADNDEEDAGTATNRASTPAGVTRRLGPRVSAGEITAGTEAAVRRYSPADIVAIVLAHEAEGLSQDEVDARVRALVEDWAEQGNAGDVPDSKIPAGIVRSAALTRAIEDFVPAATITAERTAAITAALAELDFVTDGGAYDQTSAYEAQTIVRHEGATYLSNRMVAANTQASTEPGVGADWETYWDRLGYEDGPPNALVGASLDRENRTLEFTRESGRNPLQVSIPDDSGGYTFFETFNPRTTPAFSLTEVSTSTQVAEDGEYTQVLLEATERLTPGQPVTTDYEGAIQFNSTNGRRIVELAVGYTLFPDDAARQHTTWRLSRIELRADESVTYPADGFSNIGTLDVGTPLPLDGGGIYNLVAADFDSAIPIRVTLRLRGYNQADGTRQSMTFSELIWHQPQLVAYQIGPVRGAAHGRIERVLFQGLADIMPTDESYHTLTPLVMSPISVEHGSGAAELVSYSGSGDTLRLRAGLYALELDIKHGSTSGFVGIGVRITVGDTIVDMAEPFLASAAATDPDAISVGFLPLAEDADFTVSIRRVGGPGGPDLPVRANTVLRIVRFPTGERGEKGDNGTTAFSPTDLGTTTFDLSGTAADVALVSAPNTPIVCPASGYILAIINVPSLGIVGSLSWMLAADLRDATADDTLVAGLYTNAANEIYFHAGTQDGGASVGNEVIIQHVGTTTDESGSAATILPSIQRFEVTGDASPSPGSIAGDRYGFEIGISQSAEVGAARVVGFAGAPERNPSSVAVLHTVPAGSYHADSGTLTIPAGVNLAAAGDQYTLRLEVYPVGTPTSDAPTIYHDYVITAQAPAALVHFGVVQYNADDTTVAQRAARIVFDDDDISSAGSAAGDWVFSGIPNDGNEYIPYWAVPGTAAQPTRWVSSNFDITNFLEPPVERVIGGVTYQIYMYQSDSRADDSLNGTTVTTS